MDINEVNSVNTSQASSYINSAPEPKKEAEALETTQESVEEPNANVDILA